MVWTSSTSTTRARRHRPRDRHREPRPAAAAAAARAPSWRRRPAAAAQARRQRQAGAARRAPARAAPPGRSRAPRGRAAVRRHRHERGGAASSPAGRSAAICAAIRSATGSAPRNFSARTSARAGPSWASGAHARSKAAPRAGQAAHGPGSAQRGQRGPRSHGSARRQAPHSTAPRLAQRRAAGERRPAARRARASSASTRGAASPRSRASPARERARARGAQSARRVAGHSWTFAPGVLIAPRRARRRLRAALAARRAPRGGPRAAERLARWPLLGGLALLLVALVSPVDRARRAALVMHMVQHLLLLDVAPILLILGAHEGASCARPRAASTASSARPARRPPGLRGRRLRRRDVALARPGALRRARSRTPASTCSST